MLLLFAMKRGVVFLLFVILVIRLPVSHGRVTENQNRLYKFQGVYIYDSINISLSDHFTKCDNITDISQINTQVFALSQSTTTRTIQCLNQKNETIPMELLRSELEAPSVNSTKVKYYIITTDMSNSKNMTRLSADREFVETDIEVDCWNGTGWMSSYGWMKNDSRQICCSDFESEHTTCSQPIFIFKNGNSLVTERQNSIETGYGFKLPYTINIGPVETIQVDMLCGLNYECKFKGRKSISGDCSLTTKSIYKSGNQVEKYYVPYQAPEYLHPYDMNITVPYLTDTLDGAENCTARFSLDGYVIATSVITLKLKESPVIVSSSSEVGLRDIGDGVPLCVGDGFPANSTAEWKRVNAKGNIVKGRIKPIEKSMEAGQDWNCIVKRGDEEAVKPMTFIKTARNDSFSSYVDTHKTAGGLHHCNTKFSAWDPIPTRIGWTHPNGSDFSDAKYNRTVVEVENHKQEFWSFPVYESGYYICWAEVSKTWPGGQNDTFRVKMAIFVRLRDATSAHVTKVENLTTAASKQSDTPIPGAADLVVHNNNAPPTPSNHSFQASYWYFVGLGMLFIILAVFLTVIYKKVRKNQAKVTNLDTKLSLDKVQGKMGVNALYDRINIDENEPLLSRIPRIHKEDLTTNQVLGSGQFGKVLKGRLTVEDEDGHRGEMDVAVKCLMHPEQEESTEEFLKEVAMMYQLEHQNIVRLLGICTEFDQYMIVSEFMEHGNLKDFLINREPVLSLVDKLFICYQVACGLEHMMNSNIVHRDIAARNCLVGPHLMVKVADFGLSRSLSMSNYYKKIGGQVPIRWMSPEAIKYGRYTVESDVWSFGVLMWEVYTEGHFPYSGYSNEEVQTMIDNGFKLHIPPHCTEDISVLMLATWETDPKLRPTFKALRHRLNQMFRNSGVAGSPLPSPTDPEVPTASSCYTAPQPDTGTQTLVFCRDSADSHHPFFPDQGSDSSVLFHGRSTAANRYVTEPGSTSCSVTETSC